MKINLEIDPKDLNNNELAEYLIQLEQEVNSTVKNNQFALMSILIGYKIKIESVLEQRLKDKLKVDDIPF
tara:strand:+ start:579 stop:788 length:210 start_codon:yes stop_codon:yes gene_type:complete